MKYLSGDSLKESAGRELSRTPEEPSEFGRADNGAVMGLTLRTPRKEAPSGTLGRSGHLKAY